MNIPDVINSIVDTYDLYGCEVSELRWCDALFFIPVRGKSDRWLNWNIRRLLKFGYVEVVFRYWNDTAGRMVLISIRVQPDGTFEEV